MNTCCPNDDDPVVRTLPAFADSAEDQPPTATRPGRTQIMYIEQKPGLTGPARIGRVRFSKTGRTLYYGDQRFRSLNGAGFKANYFDVDSRMEYWISGCRADGRDTLYAGVVEIDEDVRVEYWQTIRNRPDLQHLSTYGSPGKHAR
jgi:hypothetical protein